MLALFGGGEFFKDRRGEGGLRFFVQSVVGAEDFLCGGVDLAVFEVS